MAEGIFKNLIGRKIFVQSAGVFDALEIDGFTIKVCNEINVKLSKHRVRSLREMEKEGGFIGSFDLIIPFTRESLAETYKYSTYSSVVIENWNVDEPIKNENDIDVSYGVYATDYADDYVYCVANASMIQYRENEKNTLQIEEQVV